MKRLRDTYFSFNERGFRNEVMPFTTGTPWDTVYRYASWTIVPEVMPFQRACEDSLLAAARPVPLPPDFFEKPLPVRVAFFFSEVLRHHLPVTILEGDLIAGGQFNTALSLCLSKREARIRSRKAESFRSAAVDVSGLGIGNCGAVPGHLIPDYPKVLRMGFRGIVEEIRREQTTEPDMARRATLESFAIACSAAHALAGRYADEAERQAVDATPERAAELRQLAAICRKVPWEPAATFHEALQSLWLTHMLVLACESYPGAGVSFGRIDQYLFPFYARDMEEGRMTHGQARELLQCFFIKPNYAYDYQGRMGRNQGINSSFGQLITLAGCGPQGEDRANELTYVFLDVMEAMNMLEPKPNVRLHAKSPERLLTRVCDLLARAQGAPFLLNFDETSMRGLKAQGLPESDLWDYAPVGCLENTRQGDDRSGTVDVNLNLAKAVELTLFQGRDQASGRQLGPRTQDPRNMKSWPEFEKAFRAQLSSCLNKLVDLTNQADTLRATYAPTPYLSTLVGGCIEKRLDITAGGARYNYITVEGIALATAADSLSAVKRLVFEEGRVTMDALLRAIQRNYEGDEFLRQTLLNKAPKYGNDDPEGDRMARDLTHWWSEETATLKTPVTGKRYRAGYLSWNYGIAYAPLTAATPDGRKRGVFLANGVAAVTGMDKAGPTAAARAVGSLGFEAIPNGASHTITLPPSLARDEEHRRKLAGFLRGYCVEGGSALQINMIDAETLLEAQRRPDEFSHLLIRVTGYNAYFVDLGREIQNEIIARERAHSAEAPKP
ncbi:pyruvate formate lyase family protein [Roseovarius pacificus]|uniref:pyruvate formate lyase family protein n=1 Tax=Roseovarius pacificus TaxID=337701 RepID=UPI002A187AEA|nr:pyruvate formate lyase family protein [Roseovarius pacificus]